LARAETLYTPQVLALATGLAAWPWDDDLPLQGEARSKSCGSVVRLGLGLDGEGRVARVAIRAQACAIGQAAAAIFAAGAEGLKGEDIAAARDAIAGWLKANGDLPDWPELEAIAAARDYPARHGAILLAWQAAIDLLFTGEIQG
jgi:NifU-like protein involved in Fe-S cluster formation